MQRYIGDRNFYRRVFAILMPILIQNVITNFVSMLDNIMVGQIGTEPMSGVAIVNQLVFVFNLCALGGVSGAGILAAQIKNPVRWVDEVRAMIADGMDTFVECGPGKTLCGLIKKIDKTVTALQVENEETLRAAVEAIRA